VTKQLFKQCRTPKKLAAISFEELLALVRSVGLAPTKSRNLIKMAQMLLDNFDGKVPSTMEELVQLPGVGRKTASVILCQAFGQPSMPVDTHIHRLTVRWGLAPANATVQHVEAVLSELFPRDSWGAIHLQLIYFGREWCQARRHEAKDCPICSWACTKQKGGRKKDSRRPRSLAEISKMSSPKKASKQIILYSERLKALAEFEDAFINKKTCT